MALVRTVRWENLEGLDAESFIAETKPLAETAVLNTLLFATNELKVIFTGPRHGRAYRFGRHGRLHIASAPGEAPAVLFGALRASIHYLGPFWEDLTVFGDYGVDTVYAQILEWGGITKQGGRIMARPYMEPVAQKVEAAIDGIFERAGVPI